jgi:[NiFe] hydrogenase diaphorase moiety small subunit
LCNVIANGRNISACTMKAASGQEIEVDTWLGESAQAYRRTLVQMLFVEGNHFCPGCEKNGNCQLQALRRTRLSNGR